MAIPLWLSLSSKSGTGNKAINATAAKNEADSRSYILTIKVNGITKTINCVQKAADQVTLTLTCITYDSKGNVIQNVGKVSIGQDPNAGVLQKKFYIDYRESISALNGITGYYFRQWTENGEVISTDNPTNITMTEDRTIQGEYRRYNYTVKVGASDETKGTATVTLNGAALENDKADYGETVVFKATRKNGYSFGGWYDYQNQLVSKQNPFTKVISSYLILTPRWDEYNVSDTIKISPEGAGTVTPNPITGQEYNMTSATAEANSGYVFDKWIYNTTTSSTGFAESTKNPTNFTLTGKRDITAVFAKLYTVEISSNPIAYGSASPISSSVKDGNSITLTATPGSGFEFVKWIDKDTSDEYTDNPLTIVVTRNLTLQAKFQGATYSTEVKIEPSGGGTVTPNPVIGQYGGKNVSITAKANSGYEFHHWYYRYVASTYINSSSNPLSYSIRVNNDIKAVFAKLHIISVKLGDATSITDSTGTVYTESYVVSRKNGTTFVIPSATKDPTVAYNYTFKHFVDTDNNIYTAGTEITISSDIQLTPVFESKLNQYSYKFYNHAGSTLIKTITKDYDSTISSSEIPTAPTLSGYTFLGWYDTKSANGNKLNDNLTVKGDKTWYAVYSITKYKVTIVAGEGGKVEGDGFDSNGVLYAAPGTKVEIRAIPDAGNVFFKWNDQVTDATRTITVGSADIEYVALFEVASLNLNVTQLTFDGNGGTQKITVTANVDWTVS